MTAFGVHTGPSKLEASELTALWRRVEDLPFEWISIWDHFYAADGNSTNCLEGVASHTALAMTTERVRCGSLVYCAAYRHPAVLANAMAAIDRFSGGRCEVGLGAGWLEQEFTAHGIAYPQVRQRMDMLAEYTQVVKGLLGGDRFSFEGQYFTIDDAICDPPPLSRPIPIWIGGAGEKRTLRIAAEYADGWNVPFISPEQFAHKCAVLDEHCASVGRDPAEVIRSVNVGVATDDESLHRQYGMIAEFVRPGVVMGGVDRMVEGIGRFVESGAQQINVALRAPIEYDALDAIAAAIDTLG
jgi:F420-dependent oxidoreductase-like protein